MFHLIFICALTVLLVYYLFKTINKSSHDDDDPPSPPSLPVIGHLHLIGSVLVISFQSLALRYGPLIKIRLGASTCVVVSNESVAKEIFKTHELNFSSRPEFGSSKYFLYRGSRFIMAQYCDYWRFMKKLCMTKLLSVPQLNKSISIREEERIRLLKAVMECCRQGKPCDLNSELRTFTNNTICRMTMSTRCSGTNDEAEEMKELTHKCLLLAGKLSAGDILGPLQIFDFSGNGKKLVSAMQTYDHLIEKIIQQHDHKAKNGLSDDNKDLMDILLDTHRDPMAELKLTRNDIKSFLLDIFFAGTDTTATAMQWAMEELINDPKAFNKLRDEINTIVGPNRILNESDVEKLPYLRAVIRETLRLHPSAPLIIRECTEDCKVNGSTVKAKTRVLVNVYAIMRDPNCYSYPDEFMPERFMETSEEKIGEHQMEFKGQNFKYLPFGSGRRGCAGASLAMLVMHAAVGSLVQCFDWKMKDGARVDLTVGVGFAAEMARPLVCYPVQHLNPF